ncbi:MAG: OsmC family protein [Desulfurococcales archaeon]|nr:OsmC family protein [Desulfurococcales archaeon]
MSFDFQALAELFAARSEWIGDGKTKTRIHDAVLEVDNPLSVPPLNPPPGVTWPEQLFPAALAACFITTMTTINEKMKLDIKSLAVTVKPVLAVDEDGGFKFEKMLVTIELTVAPGERRRAERLAELTHKYCLISKAIKGNVEEVVETVIREA